MEKSTAEEQFGKIAESIPDAKLSKMFGCPCIKAPNGKSGAMLWKDNLVVKFPKEKVEAQLKSGRQQFDPMGGRPMKEWIVIPPEESASWQALAQKSHDAVKLLKK